jgi:hypothetical protein
VNQHGSIREFKATTRPPEPHSRAAQRRRTVDFPAPCPDQQTQLPTPIETALACRQVIPRRHKTKAQHRPSKTNRPARQSSRFRTRLPNPGAATIKKKFGAIMVGHAIVSTIPPRSRWRAARLAASRADRSSRTTVLCFSGCRSCPGSVRPTEMRTSIWTTLLVASTLRQFDSSANASRRQGNACPELRNRNLCDRCHAGIGAQHLEVLHESHRRVSPNDPVRCAGESVAAATRLRKLLSSSNSCARFALSQ